MLSPRRIRFSAGGWTLFIVYEDTSKPARNITLFDGFEIIYPGNQPPINITGFTTVPAPLPVNAKVAKFLVG